MTTPRRARWGNHLLILLAIGVVAFPLLYALAVSTQSLQQVSSRPVLAFSAHAFENYADAWRRAGMGRLLLNSLIVAVAVAIGKVAMATLTAFAIVYFPFRLKGLVFALILSTLMLPLPVRIVSTYRVAASLGWLDTYYGLVIPLWVSATATFLLRQFYKTIPVELAEAAQIDGAGPLRFLWSVLVPMSLPNLAALFVVLFVGGWNEYLWPLMITVSEKMRVVVIGIEGLVPRGGDRLPEWNVVMAAAVMALLPPVLVILGLQRWFTRGLRLTEK